MQVEPAVVKVDFDVNVLGGNVLVQNIDSYGAKGLFFINFDDEPPFLLNTPQEVDFGNNIVADGYMFATSFTLPGEYSVTGNICCNKSLIIYVTMSWV